MSLRALESQSFRIELPVPGYGPAVVTLPLGARSPRPVVIALHGSADRAEWQCGTYRGIAGPNVFVLCPSGKPRSESNQLPERFTFADPGATSAELRAALKALKARFGTHVASGPVVLAGFELGAEHAAHIAREEPAFFSRLLLAAGGLEAWSSTHAAIFGQRGGKKLVFVCTSRACNEQAELQVVFTRRAGAEARVVFAGEFGTVFDDRVANVVRREWKWLITGDERWNLER